MHFYSSLDSIKRRVQVGAHKTMMGTLPFASPCTIVRKASIKHQTLLFFFSRWALLLFASASSPLGTNTHLWWP